MEFKVLVLTGDAQLFLLLKHVLATEGFAASPAGRLEEVLDALDTVADQRVCAVMIDPSVTGLEMNAVPALRAARPRPAVIKLVNRLSQAEAGATASGEADLVLGRPFEPVLLLRFLRRLRADVLLEEGRAEADHQVLRFADLEMNIATVRVSRNGNSVALTALQFRLLRHLLQNPATVQSRQDLIAAAWPPGTEVEPRTVDIHMGHIRRALSPFGPDLIRTVRTLGYALDRSSRPKAE